MATLPQPVPLNHPPPQPTSQPPRKKLRPRNAKPKLTLDQITNNDVVQSALRIGRHARSKAPKPGEEPQALDRLLNSMAGWAYQVAPHYSLAEFVVAAQGIAGNRELRPMLGVFRLAELRDVTGDNHDADPNKDHSDGNKHGSEPGQVVQPDKGPVQADVGPVEADVGPDDDNWDELDIVPDEVIEARPVPIIQDPASASTERAQEQDNLTSELEAKIERNRLAAIQRRKTVMARLKADKETDKSPEKIGEPVARCSAGAEKDTSTDDGASSSPQAPEKEKQAIEVKGEDDSNLETGPKIASSEKETQLLKPKSVDEDRIKALTRASSEEEESEVPTPDNEIPLPPIDASKQAPQTSDFPEKTEERKSVCDDGSRVTGASEGTGKDKGDLCTLRDSKQTTCASDNHNDEDMDIEILAEFEAGDDV